MTETTAAKLGEGDALPELYRSGRAKRRRSRSLRLGAYALGLTVLGAVIILADWAVVPVGKARIHFCMVVHRFGMGLPGVSVAMAARDPRLLFCEMSWAGAGHMLLILEIGNVACHSPNL